MDVRQALEAVFGSKADPDVLDYLISCLSDEDFEWGDDAQEAYEAFGEMMVRRRRRRRLSTPACPL